LSDKIDIQGSTCALEFAGIVRRTGTSKSEFEVGDRVLVMAPNHFGTFEVVPEWACCKLQEHDNLTISLVKNLRLAIVYSYMLVGHVDCTTCLLYSSIRTGR